jgi:ESX secretion system protein EccD
MADMTDSPDLRAVVRVTVASGTRRVDLVLPSELPVAELLPELARAVGLLDRRRAAVGYALVTTDGRVLSGAPGLHTQGVVDGALLTVAALDDLPLPTARDALVEAVIEVAESSVAPWDVTAARGAARGAAGLLLVVGAIALLVEGGRWAGGLAGAVAGALVAGAIALSHARSAREPATAMLFGGAAYAAVSGTLAWPGDGRLGPAPVGVGLGILAAGAVALVGLREHRVRAVAPCAVGALLALAGLVSHAGGIDPGVVLTAVLVMLVLASSALPWLALSAAGVTPEPLGSPAAPGTESTESSQIDEQRLAVDLSAAQDLVVTGSVTVGLLLVLATPFAVSLGVAGALVALASSLAVMLRTRRYRSAVLVQVGLGSALAGLVALAGSAMWLHESWRPVVAVAATTSGALMLVVALVPVRSTPRRTRLADIVESGAVLALPPLLVLATGVLAHLER